MRKVAITLITVMIFTFMFAGNPCPADATQKIQKPKLTNVIENAETIEVNKKLDRINQFSLQDYNEIKDHADFHIRKLGNDEVEISVLPNEPE